MNEELEGYPLVTIINSTSYQAKGHVTYPGCHDNDWTALPWDTWKATSRGLCLVSKITALVNLDGSWIDAKPYTSWPGTSYSRYVLVQTSPKSFELTRRVTGEAPDQEEAEPTT